MTVPGVPTGAGAAERLLALAMAAKVSDLLDALAEAGVLDRLAEGAADAAALAADLGLDREFLDVALGQAARLGYLLRNPGGAYALSPAAGAVAAVLDLERATARWHRDNGSLLKVLRGEGRQDPLDGPAAAALRPVYDRALGGVVRTLALNVARHMPRGGLPLMVDLGGGDGSLAVEVLARAAGRAVVVDRAATEAAFHRRVPEDLRDAVRFQALDLRAPEGLEDLARTADLVVMSNIVHLLNPGERCALWRLLAGAGPLRVLVYDQFPEGVQETGPDLGLPGLGDLMVVDWLRCGVRFDCSAQALAEEAVACGLRLDRIAAPFGLPGRMVLLHTV